MTVTGFILWFEVEWLKYFPQWTFNLVRTIHFYEAILATLTIIVWHFYSVIFNPDVYPMSWAWITGDLNEHEMKLEHGLELEKIQAAERGIGPGVQEAKAIKGEKVYPVRREKEEKETPPRGLYGTIQDLNERMKNWKGV